MSEISDLHGLSIGTVPVHRLTIEQFLIPDYQRGYRWTKQQVEDLLTDVSSFKVSAGAGFYCLQPIVVRWQKDSNGLPAGWQVVDGQQRLTTIWHILDTLDSDGEAAHRVPLRYATAARDAVAAGSLEDVYRRGALETIRKWLLKDTKVCNALKENLLNKTQVIWYQTTDTDEAAQAVFARLNAGKIPLTNSELIKALLLKRPTQVDGKQGDYTAQQLQIATDWDWIEAESARPELWGWLKQPEKKMAGRIELLFELHFRQSLNQPRTSYALFEATREWLQQNPSNQASEAAAIALWQHIKNLFLRLHGWFEDTDLYHRIGFLRITGTTLPKLLDMAAGKTKSDFRDTLTKSVWQAVGVEDGDPDVEWDACAYGERRTRQVLTLHNVAAAWASTGTSGRYPFYRHHNTEWSLEHIHPQSARTDNAADNWMDSLGNLALLPNSLNKSLQDISFDQKRAQIIEWSLSAVNFVPPATRDAFLKAHLISPEQMPPERAIAFATADHSALAGWRSWSEADGLVYQEAMRQAIKKFLNE